MVEAWKERRENPIELGLGFLDLLCIREPTRRQAAAAIALMDGITRINAYYPTPQQAKQQAARTSNKGRKGR